MTLNSAFAAGVKKQMWGWIIQEECRHVGAADLLEVAGRGALLLDRLVQLAIESCPFLVEELPLLLRRFQLLVGRLEFLVDGHGFFVDRLLLLVGDFELIALCKSARVASRPSRAEQLATRQLPIQQVRRVQFWGGIVNEADKEQPLAIALDGSGRDADADRAPIALHLRPRQ